VKSISQQSRPSNKQLAYFKDHRGEEQQQLKGKTGVGTTE